jgi:uncharacterized membrane protein YgcG
LPAVTPGSRGPRVRAHLVLAALACALAALFATPAIAAAETYVVDSNGDLPNETAGTVCDTGAAPGEECTLRAAIQAADFAPGPDEIKFEASVFHGASGTSEIHIVTALPPLSAPVAIRGEACPFGSLVKPCVGIDAAPGSTTFAVTAAGVTLEDLAVGGGELGVEDKGEGLQVHGVWFGLDLEGNAASIDKGAIFVLPEGRDATVSSSESTAQPRNVFTNSIFGVVITASGAKVQGNYIGVGPDGAAAAGVAFPVKVAAMATDPVEGTEIGGELTMAQAASPACDGPCNVIVSNGGAAIGLNGESGLEAPAGPTTIRGNYVNLAADGLGPVSGEASKYGVYAIAENGKPGPAKLTVGGIAPTDTNYFLGGEESIRVEESEGLEVAGNRIGVAADDSESESPSNIAIRLTDSLVSRTAKLSRNQMVLEPGVFGIEVQDGNAEILDNQITGGQVGIRTGEYVGPDSGNLIEGNQIDEADVDGISLGDGLNQVFGNTVANSGRFGIEVDHSVHNRIGGDATGQGNMLVGNGETGEESGAIVIYGEETSRNEIAVNTGFGNTDAFIQLVGHGSHEIPNGLEPPAIAEAGETRVSGTAAPNATVRVFTKANAEPGELGAYVGQVEADATGAWKLSYETLPDGTLLAATQTSAAGTPEAGTSELTAPSAVSFSPEEQAEKEAAEREAAEKEAAEKAQREKEAAEKATRERQEREAQEQRDREAKEKEAGTGGGSGGGNSGGSSGGSGGGSSSPAPAPTPVSPQPIAKVAPKAKITAGPKGATEATTVKFKFKATNVTGAKFECRLDGGKWASCKSPKTYKNLAPGKHTFKVRAKANGMTGAAVKSQFTIKA